MPSPKRPSGEGGIERRVQRDGTVRFRVRLRLDGTKQTLGTFASETEAETVLAAALERLHRTAPVAGKTLRAWSSEWLDAREVDGVHRSVARDRHAVKRWRNAELAGLALAEITPRDIRGWLSEQLAGKPARQTVANALNLLRVCLRAATEKGLLERNPADGIRVPKIASTSERWTWLRPHELDVLLEGDSEQRDIFAVAVFTGLRAGELFGLEWPDVDLQNGVATVRQSWLGSATKPGTVRRVVLLQPAVDALKRQRKRWPKARAVFPSSDGQLRTKGGMRALSRLLRAAVGRHVRFHDLRHTCASHLIQGTWAPRWIARPLRLEEVSTWLGHGSLTITQRYAHLCPEGLAGLAVRASERSNVVPIRKVRGVSSRRDQRQSSEDQGG